MPFVCQITKEKYKHTQNIHGNSGYMNAPWGYIIGTLPVLLEIMAFGSLSYNLSTLKLLWLTSGIYLHHFLKQNCIIVDMAFISLHYFYCSICSVPHWDWT